MGFTQLETFSLFCDLARTHSVAATARHFGLTRKAARRQLALLEREFKTGLADCRGKKIQITPAGRLCRRCGVRIDGTIRRLDAVLRQARERAANEFDLAVCFSIGFHQLPARRRAFMKPWATSKWTWA